jgi:hypothetical protein
MAAIKLDGLSLPEAEEAIAEIWCWLEEYDIPSPVMDVDIRADAGIAMEFRFEEPIWAELVRIRLSNWMRNALPSGAASGAHLKCYRRRSASSNAGRSDITPSARRGDFPTRRRDHDLATIVPAGET